MKTTRICMTAFGLCVVISLLLTTSVIAQNLGPQSLAYHTVGLHADGNVYTWGYNSYGQLGNGNTGTDSNTPVQVQESGGGDFSLPVTLSAFNATISGDNVVLRWRTETEVDNVGFSIFRSEERDGGYVEITFVKGAGNRGMPTDYPYGST